MRVPVRLLSVSGIAAIGDERHKIARSAAGKHRAGRVGKMSSISTVHRPQTFLNSSSLPDDFNWQIYRLAPGTTRWRYRAAIPAPENPAEFTLFSSGDIARRADPESTR